jgi:hypothetical protein
MGDWKLLTNHGHALLCVAREPGMRLRDVAECVGITERAAHRIVSDLCRADYLTRHRNGRRNSYELHPEAPLRPEQLSDHTIGDLLGALTSEAAEPQPAADTAGSE